jgi:hypothetical protein
MYARNPSLTIISATGYFNTNLRPILGVNGANYEKSRDCIINADLAVILGNLVICKRT